MPSKQVLWDRRSWDLTSGRIFNRRDIRFPDYRKAGCYFMRGRQAVRLRSFVKAFSTHIAETRYPMGRTLDVDRVWSAALETDKSFWIKFMEWLRAKAPRDRELARASKKYEEMMLNDRLKL
jgi:hypothetical protein